MSSRYPPSRWKLGALLLALCLASRLAPVSFADTAPKSAKVSLPEVFDKAVPESIEDLKAIQQQVKTVLARVLSCTVNIRIGGGQGSGVLVSADGLILTAGHVSGEPGRAAVITLPNGRVVKGKTLGLNRGMDSGMAQITTEGKWPFVPLGKSADLKRGQWCIALGHPGGYQDGRSPVVRVGRIIDAGAALIRTDCAIVGGDSGGPLYDMQGRVIGIHSRIGDPLTANIHVPVDTYHDTWEQLVKAENIRPKYVRNDPYVGVKGDNESPQCKITYVAPGSPAAKAGLKVDDVVTRFGRHKVGDYEDLRTQIWRHRPGDAVVMEVQRGEEQVTLKLLVGKRPPD